METSGLAGLQKGGTIRYVVAHKQALVAAAKRTELARPYKQGLSLAWSALGAVPEEQREQLLAGMG